MKTKTLPVIRKIEKLILGAWNAHDPRPAKEAKENVRSVEIVCWPDVAKYGLRVAEISLLAQSARLHAGSTWSQYDEGATACYYAERLAVDPVAEDYDHIRFLLLEALGFSEA